MTPPEAPDLKPGIRPPAVSVCLETLQNRPDFLAAARARRQGTASFMLQARKRREDENVPTDQIRVGFTCSKKVGNAVARNRAKRRLREAARAVLPQHGKPGWDYVLIGRAGITADRDFQDMLGDLRYALKKVHAPAQPRTTPLSGQGRKPQKMTRETETRYRVTGMDCPSCAAKIEKAALANGADDIKVSTVTQIMGLSASSANLSKIEGAITALGYHLEELPTTDGAEPVEGTLSHLTPAYRRAMWIVVLLNVGYGIIEMAGGFLSGSQALKADALDFLGDGLISFIGILAIGWTLIWRARTALLQAAFLGAMGLGVLANTAYRLFVENLPDAGLMGGFGAVALLVNVAAALVLIPHRSGDANMRAIWLFSRNDAIGNAAVVVAAGLVALLETNLPDLIVAAGISGLFLHSAWSIARDARAELSA